MSVTFSLYVNIIAVGQVLILLLCLSFLAFLLLLSLHWIPPYPFFLHLLKAGEASLLQTCRFFYQSLFLSSILYVCFYSEHDPPSPLKSI